MLNIDVHHLLHNIVTERHQGAEQGAECEPVASSDWAALVAT